MDVSRKGQSMTPEEALEDVVHSEVDVYVLPYREYHALKIAAIHKMVANPPMFEQLSQWHIIPEQFTIRGTIVKPCVDVTDPPVSYRARP